MTSETASSRPLDRSTVNSLAWICAAVAGWTFGMIGLALAGFFEVPAEKPAVAVLLALATPVVIFVGLVRLSPSMRALVMKLDPVLLAELQAWRIIGAVFLVLYVFGHLPGVFAWPAGLGDLAVGVAAPWVAWKLRRRPSFRNHYGYRLFHYAGLLDFAVAIGLGMVARNGVPGLVEGPTTAIMGQMPLVWLLTVAVPLFIILHLAALLQVRVKGG